MSTPSTSKRDSTSIRLSEQDEQFIQKLIDAGPARNKTGAISYALWLAVQQLDKSAA